MKPFVSAFVVVNALFVGGIIAIWLIALSLDLWGPRVLGQTLVSALWENWLLWFGFPAFVSFGLYSATWVDTQGDMVMIFPADDPESAERAGGSIVALTFCIIPALLLIAYALNAGVLPIENPHPASVIWSEPG